MQPGFFAFENIVFNAKLHHYGDS